MGKFLFQARYGSEGAKGLVKEGGTGRRAAVEKVVTGLGGKVEAFYYAFGDVDAYVVCDLPDAATAASMALAVNQSGRVSVSTTVLMTCEEMDKIAKKTIDYKPPGG